MHTHNLTNKHIRFILPQPHSFLQLLSDFSLNLQKLFQFGHYFYEIMEKKRFKKNNH